MMPKAIALYSGGLDSILAILVVMKQGIDVTAVTFLTQIGCAVSDKSSCHQKVLSAADLFGFHLMLHDLSEKFIGVIKNPRFGYGKNMNPCLDCKILMLREAKKLMIERDADFIVTGEVIWQRPMSQRRDTFPRIDRESGLEGYVLRPLSAKHLRPTIPEQRELVCRESLYDFSGRSRKPQIALAAEFGLVDYPQPAGGCLLTDPVYACRLKELLMHDTDPSLKDLTLLRTGRHFRVSGNCKIIVGRNEKENETIQATAEDTDYLLTVEDFGSPVTLIKGDVPAGTIQLAASICARYSDARHLSAVEVTVRKNEEVFTIQATPATDSVTEVLRIQTR
ncbi:MAG: hypothetical protein ACLPX5_13815 [Dissulfurispiraceae bacterium]